jgi:hypothetical protein
MIFRFSLSNEDKGTLILRKDPQGWKDLEVIVKRGLQYHGIFYETMIQLEFSCGSGKEFIDEIYEEYGVDAIINIKIEISCTGSGGSDISEDYSDDYSDEYGSMSDTAGVILFETFYEGVLDLGKYNRTERSTFVDILQSDFIQKVINRFETPVELTQNTSLDNVALSPIAGFPSTITLHSKALRLNANYEYLTDTADTIFVANPVDFINIEVPALPIIDDFNGAEMAEAPYSYSFYQSGNPQGIDKTQPIFTNTSLEPIVVDIDINIVGTLSVRNSRSFTGAFNFWFQPYGVVFDIEGEQAAGFIQQITGIEFGTSIQEDIAVNGVHSDTYTIEPGEKIFLCFGIIDVAGDNVSPSLFEYLGFTPTTFSINIGSTSVTPSTTADFYKIHEVGAAIAQRITSEENIFRSDLLGRKDSQPNPYDSNGCMSFAGVCNGKHLRGISSPLFSSMDHYFNSINSYYPSGLGFQIENDEYVLRLEEREYFYDSSTVILQCPFAKDIKTSVAKEYYIGDIFIGYRKWEVENINGLDEVNSKRTYSTGLKSIGLKLDLESPYVGGMYAIELTRRKGLSTTDSDYDDENFIICTSRDTNGSGVPNNMDEAEKDENFSQVNNILEPDTSYNLRITPTRNLLRHLKYIASSIYKQVGRAVRFTYGEGNYEAQTEINDNVCFLGNYDNELLLESQNIAWDDVNEPATPVYIPEYIEFEYPVSFTNYLIIKNNPYKCIEVSSGNSTFIKGFIIEVRWKPVGGLAYFKLLRAWQ